MALLAVNGWLFGVGRTCAGLICQTVFTGANIGLDMMLVAGLGWAAAGAGIGPCIAEWIGRATRRGAR